MLRIIWNVLSFDQKVILSIFIFWRAHLRASWRAHYLKFHQILDIDLKFMSIKFCWQIIFSLEDIANHVTKSENHKMAPTWRHAWRISKKIVCHETSWHDKWSWKFSCWLNNDNIEKCSAQNMEERKKNILELNLTCWQVRWYAISADSDWTGMDTKINVITKKWWWSSLHSCEFIFF